MTRDVNLKKKKTVKGDAEGGSGPGNLWLSKLQTKSNLIFKGEMADPRGGGGVGV